jgi:hypothetical protein
MAHGTVPLQKSPLGFADHPSLLNTYGHTADLSH